VSIKNKITSCLSAFAAAAAATTLISLPSSAPAADMGQHGRVIQASQVQHPNSEDSWKIVLAEQPLGMSWVDDFLYGKDSCHSFLALIGPNGEVASEFHGMAHNLDTGVLRNTDSIPSNAFNAITHSLHIPDQVRRNIPGLGQLDNTRIKFVPTKGEWRLELLPEGDYTQVIFEGTKEEVMNKWLRAGEAGHAFNKLDKSYVLGSANNGGQNSNSVTRLLLTAMGLNIPEEHFLLAPVGYANDFAAQYPHLLDEMNKARIGGSSNDLDAALMEMIYRKGSMYYATNDPGQPPPEPPNSFILATSSP
jgi:hypothetical protein